MKEKKTEKAKESNLLMEEIKEKHRIEETLCKDNNFKKRSTLIANSNKSYEEHINEHNEMNEE